MTFFATRPWAFPTGRSLTPWEQRWRPITTALFTGLVAITHADSPAQAMLNTQMRSGIAWGMIQHPQPVRPQPQPTLAPGFPDPARLAQTSPAPPSPQAAPPEQPPTASMPALAVTMNQIEVLSAGAEPRSPVRYQLQAGDRHDATLSIDTTIAARVGDRVLPTPTMPRLEFDLHTLIQDPPSPELLTYILTYDQVRALKTPEVDPTLLEMFEPMLSTLGGIGVQVTMDAIGTVESMQVTLPDDADPVMRSVLEQLPQSMGQLSFPLPTAALGVGAQWRATSQMRIGALVMEQAVTYTLVAREGDRLTLTAELSQSLLPEQSAAIAAGLQAVNTTGTGNIELMLDRPLPTQAQLRLHSITEIQDPTQGAEPLHTETSLEMNVTTRQP